MAKTLCFIVVLSICLLIVDFTRAQEKYPSPAISTKRETLADSPFASPEADSPSTLPEAEPPSTSPDQVESPPKSPASSPEPESLADSPSPPPPPPQPESPTTQSPSPIPAPVPAPYEDGSDDNDSEQETEYFPSSAPSPAPGVRKPADVKASDNTSEDEEEFEKDTGEESGMSGLKKAGIAIGAILGVGAIVIGALVYKKRKDNQTRARYSYFESEFL